jgi:hypothetical protein
MSENIKAVENHGCIVCARVFNVLAVYSPNGGWWIVPDKHKPLVACDIHTADEVEFVYERWKSRIGKVFDHEQEEE